MEDATTSKDEGALVPGKLQNVRELQRQRWMQKKEEGAGSAPPAEEAGEQAEESSLPHAAGGSTAASSSTKSAVAASAEVSATAEGASATSSSQAPQEPLPPVRRLHLLPFVEADAKIGSRARIDIIAPELRRRRASQEVIMCGELFTQDGLDFAVTNCEPDMGPLGAETDYFFDGAPIVFFEKIQFSCWGPTEMTTDALFSECISPYFKGDPQHGDYRAYGATGAKRVRLFQNDDVFQIGEIFLHVEAALPAGPCIGVVTTQTEIFANWDHTAEYEKIHIVPFQDTLPRAYDYDIFNDYLRPYLDKNKHKKLQSNDLFTWQGVQFKVVACDPPDNPARVGKSTTIFCEGVLHPSLRNLLPPELLHQVAQLPPGLQMLLLNTERTTRELEDMLSHRRGLFEDTLEQLDSFNWPPAASDSTSQSTCMICLGDFEDGIECRRLPCRHVFHSACIDEWLRRCTDCPICKANVDRAIRNY